jgi:NDP-sugar pyrophosphorylase family protein
MIVFIPTAGMGTRLKENTAYLNKSLLDINNKPVISHIIEKFPKNTKFVIALGYKGNLVKQYLNLAHGNKKFKFVNVFPYKGVKSGLGLTLIKSSNFLKDKFIFISCDTLIKNKIKNSSYNWVGYSNKKAGTEYRSVNLKNGQLLKINEKNKTYKNKKTYIGLAFIKNYKEFWKYAKSNYKITKSQGEVFAINKLLKNNKFKAKKIIWNDVGNLSNYKITKLKFNKNNKHVILPKKEEAIWFVNDVVLKYSHDEKFIKKRINRAKILNNFVPKILKFSKNIYVYKYINGKIMSKNLTLYNFIKLMKFLEKFWKKNPRTNKKEFRRRCLKFYKNKTLNRINIFNKKYNFKDKNHIINNIKVEKIRRVNYL